MRPCPSYRRLERPAAVLTFSPSKPAYGLIMPRYPEVFVNVADGKPLDVILERADDAMRKAGVSDGASSRRIFRSNMRVSRERLRLIISGSG
jgi:hypothetical protein